MKITQEEHMNILDEIASVIIPPEGSFMIAEFMEERGIASSRYGSVKRRFKKAVEENRMVYHGRFPYSEGTAGYYSEV